MKPPPSMILPELTGRLYQRQPNGRMVPVRSFGLICEGGQVTEVEALVAGDRRAYRMALATVEAKKTPPTTVMYEVVGG